MDKNQIRRELLNIRDYLINKTYLSEQISSKLISYI
ncbi:5-formyltetrahydrofolate cyclo-ligase, partial [Francisella tularensis subsp. holarctica]|nr:5-formyltetrahydrofolate cyclo-ligase [Francisella tularensis subsp. holarctica]